MNEVARAPGSVSLSSPHGTGETASLRELIGRAEAVTRSRQAALWLAEGVLGIRAGSLFAARVDLEDALDPAVVASMERALARLRSGEPLQYVVGTWSFFGLDLEVDRRALIPRPETEELAALALDELERLARRAESEPVGPVVVADLGTGSGAIALVLATEGRERLAAMPGSQEGPILEVWATDASREALELAAVNCKRVLEGPTSPSVRSWARVELALGSWYEALPVGLKGRLSLVVSNPPYVSAEEWEGLDSRVRDHEPYHALVAGPTGTEGVQAVISSAPSWLAPGGCLLVEIAPHQAERACEMAVDAGFGSVGVRRDLSGRERILVARLAEALG